MATVDTPRLPLDKAVWGTCNPCPMPNLDPYNYPIVAATPHDWYKPAVFVSGCENPANAASGSSSTGGGSFLYDPTEDSWMDIPHFLGMDPDYSVAGIYSHGAATFHPTGPTGTATAGSASGITIDKYLTGDVAVGATIRITGGTGAGQSRTITNTASQTRSSTYLPSYRMGSLAQTFIGAAGVVSVNTPAGVQPGDLMVTVFHNMNQLVNISSIPSGWTAVTDVLGSTIWSVQAFVKVAGSSEPASYSWTTAHIGGNTYVDVFAVKQATYVTYGAQYSITLPFSYTWAARSPVVGHRCGMMVLGLNRSGLLTQVYNGVSPTETKTGITIHDLATAHGEESSPYQAPKTILAEGPGQTGWLGFLVKATGTYTESTVLTVDSPWSVQPDATSTYEIDSGSFWCWRSNASDSSWKWSKYDIVRGVWEQKNATDSVVAPTYINSTVNVDSTGTASTTVSVPAGTADGDLMIAALTTGQGGATAPAGWTLLGYANSGGGTCSTMYVFYRIASSEPASYSFPRDGLTGGCVATCVTYRGAGIPTLVIANGDNVPRASVTYAIPNVFQLPAVVASFVQNRADESYPGQWFCQPISVSDTYRNGSTNSRFGDQVISASAASGTTSFSWFIDPYNTGSKISWMAWGSVLIPAAAGPGMSNYGKADPTRQGGIHATTDDSNYIWLGGDAQTSLRRYSISGDSWSALTAHEPYTRPMRNVGGGMAYQTVSGDPYIFYWVPNESENAYDNTARFYAYDLTSNLWYDLLVSPGSPVSAMPSKYKRILSYGDRILWLSDRSEVVVHDPTKINALTPDNYLALVRNAPSRSGGTPFMVTDSTTGSKWLYHMEHTNVQGIQPLRCNVTGRDWA